MGGGGQRRVAAAFDRRRDGANRAVAVEVATDDSLKGLHVPRAAGDTGALRDEVAACVDVPGDEEVGGTVLPRHAVHAARQLDGKRYPGAEGAGRGVAAAVAQLDARRSIVEEKRVGDLRQGRAT